MERHALNDSLVWLFAPGHMPSLLEKAMHSSADVLIIDWEDAVPMDCKDDARRQTVDWLKAIEPIKPVFVRVNSDHLMRTDLSVLSTVRTAGVMVPKAETGDQVQAAAALDRMIVPLIESPLGLESVRDIVQACSLVSAVAFGSLDFMAAFGLLPTLESALLQAAMTRLVVAARAAGAETIIDGVDSDLSGSARTVEAARFARECGFTAKLAVHPNQIPAIRSGFEPTTDDVLYAEEVIAGFEDGLSRGAGAIRVRGQLVDRPVYNWALSVTRRRRA